jgi:hypothetical protein
VLERTFVGCNRTLHSRAHRSLVCVRLCPSAVPFTFATIRADPASPSPQRTGKRRFARYWAARPATVPLSRWCKACSGKWRGGHRDERLERRPAGSVGDPPARHGSARAAERRSGRRKRANPRSGSKSERTRDSERAEPERPPTGSLKAASFLHHVCVRSVSRGVGCILLPKPGRTLAPATAAWSISVAAPAHRDRHRRRRARPEYRARRCLLGTGGRWRARRRCRNDTRFPSCQCVL